MKTIFCSVQAVEKLFIEKQAGGSKNILLVANILSPQTVGQSALYDAICVGPTDDISAPVLEELCKNGIRYITIRATCNPTADLARSAAMGIIVAHTPAFSPGADGNSSASVAEYAVAVTFYNLDCRKKDLYSGNELTPATGLAPATVYFR